MPNRQQTTKILLVIAGLLLSLITVNHHYSLNKLKERHRQEKKQLTQEYDNLQKLTDKIILERDAQLLEKAKQMEELNIQIQKLKSYLQIKNVNFIDNIEQSPNFKVTAYDLSIQSCSKPRTAKGFGITRSGYKLTGKDLRTASTISTDPKVIPLGTYVYLYFGIDSIYNGIYISSDTGNGIRGNHIDLYIGDNNSTKQALNFGIKYAKVIILDKI